jgi:hypothetical protein
MRQGSAENFFTRKMALLIIVCIVSIALMASRCDDDDDSNNANAEISEIENILTDGTWRVSYFFDDTDETTDYSGYIFTFADNGTATAVSGATTINGTWDVRQDDGVVKLDVNFGATTPWDDLQDDWDIIEHTNNRIVMEDESGGSGEIDYLTLEKN